MESEGGGWDRRESEAERGRYWDVKVLLSYVFNDAHFPPKCED